MKNNGKKHMSRFSVEIELTNNADMVEAERGHLDPAKVRRMKIQGLVDPGATRMVLPAAVVKELGLPIKDQKIQVRYTDGRRALRKEVAGVHVAMQGRAGLFQAVVEPKRETALIGAIVLEDLDFLVGCGKQCLVPRDPHFVVNEIG
jgi:predicted aspartyl protease